MTVSISVERYLNCCYPNQDIALKSLLVPFPILFTVIYNIPKFFELTSCADEIFLLPEITRNVPRSYYTNHSVSLAHLKYYDPSHNSNYTLYGDKYVDTRANVSVANLVPEVYLPNKTEDFPCTEGYRTTWLRNNPWYIIFYVFWSKFIFVEILPWVTVIILTLITTRKIQQFQARRERLLGTNRTGGMTDEGNICCIYVI